MPQSLSALHRSLALVAVTVPAVVLACSTDVTPLTGPGTPSATTTSTSPTQPSATATTTPTSTATTPPQADGGVDAAKDSGPPPTDVAGSAECTAYCAKMKSQCNQTCIPTEDCKIESGQCAASTRDYLDCETTQGTWYCGADGFSIVSSCNRDTSLCK